MIVLNNGEAKVVFETEVEFNIVEAGKDIAPEIEELIMNYLTEDGSGDETVMMMDSITKHERIVLITAILNEVMKKIANS